MNLSLAGRTALITGGSQGLGKAMAAAFYGAGAKVAIIARRQTVLDEACAEISSKGNAEGSATTSAAIVGFACDVTDGEQIKAVHDAVTEAFGGVDILVNNAGQASVGPFMEATDEVWQTDIDLKLMAAVRLTRLVWPHMCEQQHGRIINLLNVQAKAPTANTAPTSVTRAAGMALTKVLSAEGAAHNILVNAMLIGLIKSEQIKRMHSAAAPNMALDDFIDQTGSRLPMGRMGEAEECANLAHFLASDAASYITGCAINMDGGMSKVV